MWSHYFHIILYVSTKNYVFIIKRLINSRQILQVVRQFFFIVFIRFVYSFRILIPIIEILFVIVDVFSIMDLACFYCINIYINIIIHIYYIRFIFLLRTGSFRGFNFTYTFTIYFINLIYRRVKMINFVYLQTLCFLGFKLFCYFFN